MAKGSGSGSRGSGGSTSWTAARIQRAVATLGGAYSLRNRDDLPRSARLDQAYAGLTKAQVQRLATGQARAPNGDKLPPIEIGIGLARGGKPNRMGLDDGNHRLTAARKHGATHILATVSVAGARGRELKRWTGIIKL